VIDSQQKLPNYYSDAIDLRELFHLFWAGKWLIAGVTFAMAILAVVVTLMMPNIYKAEALLAPNDREGSSGLSSLAAQYGGLASLAGIQFSREAADKTALGLEVLESRKFISEFIERRDILVPLMAAEDWDAESGELRINPKVYDLATHEWMRDVRPPRQANPSYQEAYAEFMKILSVNQDRASGLVTVSIEHYSPIVAKQWVDWLVEDINSSIMQQDVAEAEQAIEYLYEQIESTSLAGLQMVFFELIEEQTKTVMLAKVSTEYLLKTLDPAVVPEQKAKPNRSLMVVLAAMLGGFLGVFAQLVRHSIVSATEKSAG